MKLRQLQHLRSHILTLAILISISHVKAASVKDIFNLNPDGTPRLPRDSKYYIDRSDGQRDISSTRSLKPEESPEARDSQPNTGIEKRCSRCDSYTDYRGSSGTPNYRSDYYRYQDPGSNSRYDSRKYYDDRYDTYDRYDNYDPYYDSYYERDRYRRPSYSGRDEYDRYEPRDRYYNNYNTGRDRYYDRQYDRGTGYDNIGYDYRGYDSRSGSRPYDETYRGVSGWDSSGRGYYSNRGSPESAGRWGTYASNWGYGRDDRDRGYRDYG
ncbi:hypothetical protein AMK59_4382 [Oryctes borbonicus]|uniref:Uncharacterized protein n=1 Tax=Oryctes borbonicus TaxID=1629725 RepID=A0A0T6B8K3_9SCAR|nr:hypothetical protein AMK59_4382 [Oryctes borbonicus]